MRHLHRYVPSNNGQLTAIPCHGDGLSVERMYDAIRHNSGAETAEERLEGVVPIPQEFHKRMILLQVGDIVEETSALNYIRRCTEINVVCDCHR